MIAQLDYTIFLDLVVCKTNMNCLCQTGCPGSLEYTSPKLNNDVRKPLNCNYLYGRPNFEVKKFLYVDCIEVMSLQCRLVPAISGTQLISRQAVNYTNFICKFSGVVYPKRNSS